VPSPIGHLLAGYVVHSIRGERFQNKLVFFGTLFSAVAADLDFLPGIVLGDPNRFHHGITHSIGAACFYGIAMWGALRCCRVSKTLLLALLFASAYGSHLVLDFFSVDNSDPRGSPLFWPLVDTYYIAPVSLFLDIQRPQGGTLTLLAGVFSMHNLLTILWEVVVLIPFVIWAQQRRAEKQRVLRPVGSFDALTGVDSLGRRSSKETGQ